MPVRPEAEIQFDVHDQAAPGMLNAIAHETQQRYPIPRSDAHGMAGWGITWWRYGQPTVAWL